MSNEKYPDLEIQNEGTLFLVHPRTDTGARWIGENVQEDAQFFGQALVVEHRYISDLVSGAQDDGLRVV
jgi:hypothetical protein